jgi:hypothetical protein
MDMGIDNRQIETAYPILILSGRDGKRLDLRFTFTTSAPKGAVNVGLNNHQDESP